MANMLFQACWPWVFNAFSSMLATVFEYVPLDTGNGPHENTKYLLKGFESHSNDVRATLNREFHGAERT